MTVPTHQHISINGLDLHYLEWPTRHKQTVLLLHGFANCAATWCHTATHLAANRRVLALDFRGHGDSAWAEPGTYRLENHAADVSELIRKLGLENIFLVGHSMGGAVAQCLAAEKSNRVARLVDVDNGPVFPAAGLRRVRRQGAAAAAYDSLEEYVAYLRIGDPLAPPEVLLREATDLTQKAADGRYVLKSHLRPGGRPLTPNAADIEKRWRLLAAIDCPTLILRGARSDMFGRATAKRMARIIPGAVYREIPGAGHYLHRDNATAFVAALTGFLPH